MLPSFLDYLQLSLSIPGRFDPSQLVVSPLKSQSHGNAFAVLKCWFDEKRSLTVVFLFRRDQVEDDLYELTAIIPEGLESIELHLVRESERRIAQSVARFICKAAGIDPTPGEMRQRMRKSTRLKDAG